MIGIPFARDKVLRWTLAAFAVAALVWYSQEYRPTAAALGMRESAVAGREARVQAARAATVVLGPAGLDSLLERFRSDSAALAVQIPAAASAPAVAAEVKDVLSRAARQLGVRIAATEPLPPAAEGAFQGGGYAVKVVGRYRDIAALVAALGSTPRVTRIRGLRLHAIPDSLVRAATPYGTATPGANPTSTDSTGSAMGFADAGEPPFTALAVFSLIWYTLPPGAAADTVSAPSSFAPQGSR